MSNEPRMLIIALLFMTLNTSGCRKPTSPSDLPAATTGVPSTSAGSSEPTGKYAPVGDNAGAAEDRTVVEETIYTVVSSENMPQLPVDSHFSVTAKNQDAART